MGFSPGGLSPVDIVVGLVLTVSVLLGLWRGLIYEALALMNWVLAFVIANLVAPLVADWMDVGASLSGFKYFIAFAIVFVVALLIGGWLSSWIKAWVAQSRLRAADRSLGALFGLSRAVMVLWVVAFVVSAMGWRDAELWARAVSTPWLDAAVDWAKTRSELPVNLKKE